MSQNKAEVTLLVVEDDDLDAMAIKRTFKKLKVANNLVRAKDGVDALEYLRGENGKDKIAKPFMVLLDLNMPRMNGIELLQTMRMDDELKDSIVFVLTTSATDKDKVAAYDNNVAGYIVKSDIESSFLEVIELLDCYWKIVALPR
ncbi:two-component system response regulator [Gammaproteobacteria bacterium 42_54_T18]|nr:two-component system response regulator [Gammaproteobacteria bacterium 42_54_T18]